MPDPIAPAPPGFRWVYNRLNEVYEDMFDHVPYTFKAHEQRLMQEDIATFLHAHSAISVDLKTNRGKAALVVDGDKNYLVPLEGGRPEELIDRKSGDNPLGRGTGGLKTKAAKVPVE